MIRAVAELVVALSIAAPNFSPRTDAAAELVELGRRHRLDPLTIVAVVKRESGWNPRAIGRLGEVGLGQVHANVMQPCRSSGEVCDHYRSSLLDWRFNLRTTARLMEGWRTYCRRTVGSGLARFWLAGYGGRVGVCGHVRRAGRLVPLPIHPDDRRVLDDRRKLEGMIRAHGCARSAGGTR